MNARLRQTLLLAAVAASLAGTADAGTANAGTAAAADLAGTYADRGGKLTLTLTADGPGGYTGTAATPAGRRFDLAGRTAADGTLTGSFVSNGRPYPFTASLADGRLAFATGGATYDMARQDAPANPAGGGPTPPANASAADWTTFEMGNHLQTVRLPKDWDREYTPKGAQMQAPTGERLLYHVLVPFQPPAVAGGKQPDPADGPIAAFTGPAEALSALAAATAEQARAAGQPDRRLGPIVANHPVRATHAGGRAAVVEYTLLKGDQVRRAVARVECVPGPKPDGPWTLEMTELSASADRFDAAAPMLAAILRSVQSDEPRLHADFVIAAVDAGRKAKSHDLAGWVAAADPVYQAERHARETQMLALEKFYPAWAGHGATGATSPADFNELDPDGPGR